jgi:predicted enzyme related to lactoylglutathione lyase
MEVTNIIIRLYVETEKFESSIDFYETAQGLPCELRFENKEKRINGAKIGKVLILSGSKDDLAHISDIKAIFYVDSLDEFIPWLKESGAEILHDPVTIPFGRNMSVRNPDGLVLEYFEPRAE